MSTPYKFNGKELDEETGLYYYGARYYDPRTSVWISADPLAEKYPNVGSYVYCHNNPVKYTDPDGRNPALALAAGGAILEYALLTTGIITTGVLLYKGPDGMIRIRDDVKTQLGVLSIVAISTQLAQYEKFKSSLDEFSKKSKKKESEKNQATTSVASPNNHQNEENHDDNKGKKNKQETQNDKVGETKKMSEKQIGEFLGEGDDWHYDGKAKNSFVKEFSKQLKGEANPDFYIDKKTNEVVLKGRSNSKIEVRTNRILKP